MNKHRTLKAVGFFVVVAVIVAFLALPQSQAAAKGKPVPVRWKATITGANLIGLNEFVGGVDHVNINNGVGSNSTPCNTAGTGAYSYLELQVFTPSLIFNGIGGFWAFGNSELQPDPNGPYYGLPNTTAAWPYCVADFLNNNNPHPTADYPHIILRFTTCGCGNPITDLMTMGEGKILPVHMKLLIFSHIWGCPANSPFTQNTFLNLHMNAHGYVKTVGSLPDVYIRACSKVT